MPKFGDGVDAVAAFAGATLAGIALFVPITTRTGDFVDTPYQVAGVANSFSRATVLGLIVAIVVAVLIRPANRPGLVWLIAACGAAALGLNYFLGDAMSSTEVLTTQNYVNALIGGVIFGALCLCSLQLRWATVGFALGSVTVFVYGEVITLVADNMLSTTDRGLRSPSTLIVVAVVLLGVNSFRYRHSITLPAAPPLTADLPILPIVSVTVLAVSVLLATEWLERAFGAGHGTTWRVATAVAVTIVAAFVAAILLPGRDGAGVLPAVSLAAVGDSLVDIERMGWNILLVLVAGTAGILVGRRWATPWAVLLGAAVLSVFATFSAHLPLMAVWTVGTVALAGVVGYAFGSIRVGYGPSAVLGLGALYLPSIVWAIPTALRNWQYGSVAVADATVGRTALAVTIAAAAALLLLYRIRPGTSAVDP